MCQLQNLVSFLISLHVLHQVLHRQQQCFLFVLVPFECRTPLLFLDFLFAVNCVFLVKFKWRVIKSSYFAFHLLIKLIKSFIISIFCNGQNESLLEFLTHLLVWVKTDDGYQQQILLLIHCPAEVKNISRNDSWYVSNGNRFNFIQSTDCGSIKTMKVDIVRLLVSFFHHFNLLMYNDDVIPACISVCMITSDSCFSC